jgi:RNA polymerase sigma factor (TIGR02999 family)
MPAGTWDHPAMSGSANPPLTMLLKSWQQGDRAAFAQLIQHVHVELRRMAASRLRGAETPSLAAGDLLNETLLKLMDAPPDWQDRAHFFATVSRAMRSVLVDHARARQTDKRGGAWQRLSFTLSNVGEESNVADLLTLNQLLDQLAVLDPRAAEVLQLTYFGGLLRDEIATVLGLSVPTIDRELRFARAWLSAQLQRDLES